MKKRRIVELAMEADRKGAQDRTAYVNNVLPDVSKSQISRLLAAEKARRQGLITKDCTLHSFPGMRKHDEGFFVCVLYRIILSLRKRKGYEMAKEIQHKIKFLEGFQPFTGFGKDVTVKQLFEQHDWEEPFPLSSLWLQRRRALIAKVRELLCDVNGEEEGGFFTFCFAYILHNTGSDCLVEAIERDPQKIKTSGISTTAYMLASYYEEVGYNVFHSRFRPMSIRANGLIGARKKPTLSFWRNPTTEEGDDEDEDVLDWLGKDVGTGATEAGNTNVQSIAVKYMESLPNIKQLRGVWKRLAGPSAGSADPRLDPKHIWNVLATMPYFRGEGYNLKNFGLLFFTEIEMDAHSSGGSGPRRSYNVSNGSSRMAHMSNETLDFLVNRDKVAFATYYYNGNYLGGYTYSRLLPHERNIGAIVVTSNRCAYDKLTWKVAYDATPPDSFATWREYSKALRAVGT